MYAPRATTYYYRGVQNFGDNLPHQLLAEKGSSKVQAVTDIQTRTIFKEETICTWMPYYIVCNEK